MSFKFDFFGSTDAPSTEDSNDEKRLADDLSFEPKELSLHDGWFSNMLLNSGIHRLGAYTFSSVD